MTKERRYKEIGVKVYKGILHIITLAVILLIYVSLFIMDNNWWVLYLALGVYPIFRLFVLSRIGNAARERGILVTEYIEYLHKQKKE